MGGSKYQTVGYRYYMGGMLDLCMGPIDKVLRIRADEKLAWQGSHEGGVLYIEQWNLFGGEEKEGGLGGDFNFAFGGPSQTQNAYLAARTSGLLPAYRATCAVILERIYIGTSAYPKQMDFQLQRIYKKGIEGESQWYPEKAGIGEYVSVPVPPSFFSLNSTSADDCAAEWSEGLGATIGDPEGSPIIRTYTVQGTWKRWFEGFEQIPAQKYIVKFAVRGDFGESNYFYYGATEAQALDAFHEDFPGGEITFPPSSYLQFYLIDTPINDNDGGHLFTISPTQQIFVGDMNPAHIIREIITNPPECGMGYTEEDVDDDSFTLAADILFDEGFGLSFFWEGDQTAEDVLKKIVQHIDASLYVSRQTGKFVLKLHRGGYDVEDLPVFDLSNSDSFSDYSKAMFGELTTTVVVNYWNEEIVNTSTVTVSDTALAQDQGREKVEVVTYDYICNADLATRVGWRELKLKSNEFISGKLHTGKAGKQINPGDVFILNWPEYKIDNVVMRCSGVAYSDGKTNNIVLSCIQDIFSLPDNSLFAPPSVGWEDPNQEPEELTVKKVFELPYYEMAQRLGNDAANALLASNPDAGYVAVTAGRSQSNAQFARIHTDSGAGYEDVGTLDFCPFAQLDGDLLDRTLETFPISNLTDSSNIEIGSIFWINNEAFKVVSISETTCEAKRGCLDTLPQTHSDGDYLFFADTLSETDPTEYIASDEVDVKLATVTSLGELELGDISPETLILNSRANRPYLPANVKLNGEYWPSEIDGDLEITARQRNRLTQAGGSIIDFFEDSDIADESGQTYSYEVYNASTETLIDSDSGIAAFPIEIPAANLAVFSRLELFSVRDGYESFYRYVHTFSALGTPYNLEAEFDGTTTLLTWSFDGSSGDGFKIYRDTSPMDPNALPTPLATVALSEFEYEDTTVTEDETYYYRVSVYSDDPAFENVSAELEHEASMPSDPYFANVTALLHFDGTNGSTTFTDVKGNTWTASGNAQLTTSQFKFGTASLSLDGVDDDIRCASSAAFGFGTGDFTWECFVRRGNGDCVIFDNRLGSDSASIVTFIDASGNLCYFDASTKTGSGATVSLNTWTHVAVTRASGNLKMWVAGFQVFSGTKSSDMGTSKPMIVGRDIANGADFSGQIDEVRITKGVARYTANFTPPEGPFPNT